MASVVANLLGGGLLQGISGLINSIRGKNPEDAAKLAEIAEKYQQSIVDADTAARVGQLQVDAAEASNKSFFIAGWRPWIGWVCGMAFAANFVLIPGARIVAGLFGKVFVAPTFDVSELMPVLLGMLGLGTMRTVEKIQGVGKTNL